MRSAARRGALWWNQAFEQAGFRNALVIEDLPEGADPLDIRYPTIQWTNRNGRGWSVGMVQTDPRTGEILHAVVQLDSHRMRTVNNYWSVVSPGSGRDDSGIDLFAELDGADPQLSEDEVMTRRIALLTCHEMGHVLGLEHNFAASTFNRGSVMDYFAPRITTRNDGTADLSDAYMQGVGSYDKFAIEWGYSTSDSAQAPPPQDPRERATLDGIVQKALKQGIFWGNYDDPRWNAYESRAADSSSTTKSRGRPMTSMRAVQVSKAGSDFELVEREIPQPGPAHRRRLVPRPPPRPTPRNAVRLPVPDNPARSTHPHTSRPAA